VDLAKVSAHYAMNALFEERLPDSVYAFEADPEVFERHETGRARLAIGCVNIQSRITGEHERFAFGVIHLGDHNLDGGVRVYKGQELFEAMQAEVTAAFERADYPETIRLIDRHFGDHAYSLASLFRDEQRRITDVILDSTLADAESVYRHVYEDNAPLMRFLDNAHVPLPRALRTAAEFIMNADIQRALEEDPVDLDYIRDYFDDTKSWGLELDVPGIRFAMEHATRRVSRRLSEDGAGPEQFDEITELIELFEELPFHCDYWNEQNDYYEILQTRYADMKTQAAARDPLAEDWIESFERLGRALSIRVP
jgi:hypothetical protein